MQTGVVPDAVAQQLRRIDDPIVREQYLDFVKGRAFRQTLLCREDVEIDRAPRPEVLERLAVSSPVSAGDADSQTGAVTFEGPSGSRLTCNDPGEAGSRSSARRERRLVSHMISLAISLSPLEKALTGHEQSDCS